MFLVKWKNFISQDHLFKVSFPNYQFYVNEIEEIGANHDNAMVHFRKV